MKSVYGGRICVPTMTYEEPEEPMPTKKRKPKVEPVDRPPLPPAASSVALIAWEDAASGAGTIEDAAAWTLPMQYTLGFVRLVTAEKIILAGSYCSDPGCPDFGEPTGIPASLPRRAWVPTGWKEVALDDLGAEG